MNFTIILVISFRQQQSHEEISYTKMYLYILREKKLPSIQFPPYFRVYESNKEKYLYGKNILKFLLNYKKNKVHQEKLPGFVCNTV